MARFRKRDTCLLIVTMALAAVALSGCVFLEPPVDVPSIGAPDDPNEAQEPEEPDDPKEPDDPAPPAEPEEPEGPTAEVALAGGVWTATIEDDVVYKGSRLGLAIQAAIDKLGPGVIHIRDSGALNDEIRPKAGQTLDFHHHPIGGNQGIYVYRQDNVTIRNLHMNGSPINSMLFVGSSHVHLHNIWLEFDGGSSGIRIENDRQRPIYTQDVKVTGQMLIEGTRKHGFETYGIDGLVADEIVTRNTAQSGVLLNETKNVRIGLIDAYRADPEGGYGCFRVANANGPNVVVDKVIGRECGRGFFSVSGSHGTTIHWIEIDGTNAQAIFIEDSWDTTINGGVVKGYKERGVHIIGRNSHTKQDTRNITIQNLRVENTRKNPNAIGFEEGPYSWNNEYLNNDLRNAGGRRELDFKLWPQSGSVAQGNLLTGDPAP